jgi:hypothetical protein
VDTQQEPADAVNPEPVRLLNNGVHFLERQLAREQGGDRRHDSPPSMIS